MDTNQNQKKFDVRWETDRTFTSDDGTISVVVNKLSLKRPKFSLKIVFNKGDKQMSFIPIFSSGQGKIEIKRVNAIIDILICNAQDYIEEYLQKLEDDFIENKLWHEHQSMNQGKPETRVTGKTQRDKQKHKNKK